jgi:hypothetical protein
MVLPLLYRHVVLRNSRSLLNLFELIKDNDAPLSQIQSFMIDFDDSEERLRDVLLELLSRIANLRTFVDFSDALGRLSIAQLAPAHGGSLRTLSIDIHSPEELSELAHFPLLNTLYIAFVPESADWIGPCDSTLAELSLPNLYHLDICFCIWHDHQILGLLPLLDSCFFPSLRSLRLVVEWTDATGAISPLERFLSRHSYLTSSELVLVHNYVPATAGLTVTVVSLTDHGIDPDLFALLPATAKKVRFHQLSVGELREYAPILAAKPTEHLSVTRIQVHTLRLEKSNENPVRFLWDRLFRGCREDNASDITVLGIALAVDAVLRRYRPRRIRLEDSEGLTWDESLKPV